jgi:phosphatidylglycerol:prolipoprotein diacylglycerol transferase
VLGVIQIGIDPIAFNLGSLAIHWYGVMYVVAFVVAYYLGAKPHATARGIRLDQIEKITGWTILFGLIGGRLYYDVQNLSLMQAPVDWIAVWQGGMAFYGAIVAASATILVLAWRWHLPIWVMLDAGALFAVIGQPIGRIGNIINGDILGGPSNLPWATAYTNPHAVLQSTSQVHYALCVPGACTAYQPAGAYEALATLCILGVMLVLRRRGVAPGVLFIVYLSLYAVSQFGLDFVRESEPILWLGMKELQLTAIVAFVVGLPILVVLWRRTQARAEPALASGPAAGAAVPGSKLPPAAA